MLKQWITASIYYVQETLAFLLVIVTFFTFTEQAFLASSYYLWFGFVLLVGLPVLSMVHQQEPKRVAMLYGVFAVIFILLAYLIWEMSFFVAIVFTGFAWWRLVAATKRDIDAELVIRRFISFVIVLIVAYFFIQIMDVAMDLWHVYAYLWIEFGLLLFGILYSSYLDERKEHGTKLKDWLKNQSLLLFLGGGFTFLAVIISLFLPSIQALVRRIPDILVWILNSEPVRAFLFWLMPHEQYKPRNREEEVQLNEFEISEEDLEEVATSGLFESILLVLGIAFFIFVAVATLYILYLVIRGLWSRITIRLEDDTQSVKGSRQHARSLKEPKGKVNWAQDEIRRQYQNLLLFAEQKGQAITNIHTARTWVLPYQATADTKQIWERINDLYEQKRYSETPLSQEDVRGFKEAIQEAKKELSVHVKERKKEEKLEQKLERQKKKERIKENKQELKRRKKAE